MRSARQVLALTALLSFCVTLTFGYTLRDREPWSADNQQLEEALKAIQERRRLIDDEPIGYENFAFDEEDEDPWEREEPPRGYIDPETLEYIRDMIYNTEGAVESNRLMDEESLETSDADMDELNDIMEDDDEEREDDKRIPADMHKKEYDPSSIPAKKEMKGGHIKPDEMTQDEIQQILEDEAEDALKESMNRREEGEGEEAVSDAELQNVLGDDDQPDIEENQLFPDMIAKEVNINKERYDDSLPGSYVSVKRKRSDYLPSIGDDEVAQAEEQLAEQTEGEAAEDDGEEGDDSDSAREYIKQFLALEDDENTNLANALNLATLAQVKKSDRYILEEADYIKKAIEDEQAIQMLKEELAEDDDKSEDRKRSDPVTVERAYEEQRNDIEPELEDDIAEEEKEALHGYMAAKLRQYLLRTGGVEPIRNDIPEYTEDSLGKWFNGPVSADEEGINDQDITLNPFIRDLMERIYNEGISKRAPPALIEEEYGPEIEYEEEEEEDDDIDDATRAEIATVLQAYVEEMTPTQRMLLKEAVREKLEELEEEEEIENEIGGEDEYCPAFEVLDDCEAAREAGLYLDMEAIYMCNRHQMCYSCGSSHGYSADECDEKYLTDASLLCSKERNPQKCLQHSDILLLQMRESHGWVSFSDAPPTCSETCAVEYILGIEDKNKLWIGPDQP